MLDKKNWYLTTVACAVSLLLSGQVLASEDDESSPQEEYVAADKADESAQDEGASFSGVGSLQTVIVTATRQEENFMDVPATVDVITREDMDNHIVNDISDLVRYQPGVDVARRTSGTDPFGNLTGFTVRGVGGNRVKIQVDGSRVIESIQDGNRDFVDTSMMKAVEIVRGPGSVLWGADALAGTVSFQTLDPDDLLKGKEWGVRLKAGYDTLNKSFSSTAMVSSQFTPELQGIFGFTYRTFEETRFKNASADGGIWGCSRIGMGCNRLNPLDGDSHNMLAKLVWRPNAYHQVKLVGEMYESNSDVEQLYDKYQVTGTTVNSGDYLRKQRQSRWRLGVEHEWIIDAGWVDDLKWKFSYSPQKRVLDDEREQSRTVGTTKIYSTRKTNYSEDFFQADVQLTSSFNLGKSSHLLTYGFQGDFTKSDYSRVDTSTNSATGVTTVTRGGGSNFSGAETTRYDLFIQDEINFMAGKLAFIPGVRWANYKIDPQINADYKVIVGKEPRKIDSSELIPQLSIVVKPNDQLTLYARYAEGFKMPTAQQLFTSFSSATSNVVPNPNLKPEEVKSFEVGVKKAFNNGWVAVDVFNSDYTNFIKSLQKVEGTVKDYSSLNVAKVKIWGIEASTGWSFNKSWHLNASASYQYGKERDTGDTEYSPFTDIAPLSAVVGVKWVAPQNNLDVELVGTFVSRVKRLKDDTYFRPGGYALYDAYLNWQVSKEFRLSFAVNNILNKKYYHSGASTQKVRAPSAANDRTNPLELYTGAGRSFAINATVEF